MQKPWTWEELAKIERERGEEFDIFLKEYGLLGAVALECTRETWSNRVCALDSLVSCVSCCDCPIDKIINEEPESQSTSYCEPWNYCEPWSKRGARAFSDYYEEQYYAERAEICWEEYQKKYHVKEDKLTKDKEQDSAQQLLKAALLKVAAAYRELVDPREEYGFEVSISETIRAGKAISKKELLFRSLDTEAEAYARKVFDCSSEEIARQIEDEGE